MSSSLVFALTAILTIGVCGSIFIWGWFDSRASKQLIEEALEEMKQQRH